MVGDKLVSITVVDRLGASSRIVDCHSNTPCYSSHRSDCDAMNLTQGIGYVCSVALLLVLIPGLFLLMVWKWAVDLGETERHDE